jgi:hypothetical protein
MVESNDGRERIIPTARMGDKFIAFVLFDAESNLGANLIVDPDSPSDRQVRLRGDPVIERVQLGDGRYLMYDNAGFAGIGFVGMSEYPLDGIFELDDRNKSYIQRLFDAYETQDEGKDTQRVNTTD